MANKKGILIIFSGPSGVGKDTVLEVVLDKNKELQKSISLTTREIRENEIDGKDYYFISKSNFDKMVDNNEVLEFAKYGESFYGTPKAPIDKWLDEGKTIILKIEVQGAKKIKELYPEAVGIFIMPPSMEELERRLRLRGSEDEADIQRRLDIAKSEMERRIDYDFQVINDNVDRASNEVLEIVNSLDFT